MHCNGKCHLMKEMAKAAESEKPLSSNKKDNSKHPIEELFFQDITILLATKNLDFYKKLIINNYSNLYTHEVSFRVFHPPILIA